MMEAFGCSAWKVLFLTLTVAVGAGEFSVIPSDLSATTELCPSVGIYPHPQNCRKYYLCLFDLQGSLTGIKKSCPEGRYFEPELNKCIPESGKYNCEELRRRKTAQFTMHPHHECHNLGQTKCIDCNNLLICTVASGGKLKVQARPCEEGTFCSRENGKCQTSVPECNFNSTESDESNEDNVCEDGFGAYPVPGECKKYFICLTEVSKPQFFTCPGSYVFNTRTQQCDEESSVPRCTSYSKITVADKVYYL